MGHDTKATKRIRPGIALGWAGVLMALLGLGIMHVRFTGAGVGWVLFGFYSPLVDMTLVVCGIGMAVLGLILSGWGMLVSILHKSNIHALCTVGLLIAALALVCGHCAYIECLPEYQAAAEVVREMEQQDEPLNPSAPEPPSPVEEEEPPMVPAPN